MNTGPPCDAARELAPAEAHAQRAPRLALGDLRPEDARPVLALERDEMAAGVEHRDGQRLEFARAAVRQRLVDDEWRHAARVSRVIGDAPQKVKWRHGAVPIS